MKFVLILLSAINIFGCLSANADEAALYDPIVRADEALSRVLKMTDNAISLTLQPLNKQLPRTVSLRFPAYIRATAGQLTLTSAQRNLTLDAKAGNLYTVSVKPDGSWLLMQDKKINKKGKSMLALYNFSNSRNLSLKTSNGKTSIISDIAPASSGQREINAMALHMAIYSGEGIAVVIMPSINNTRI